jgi:formyl-CoA transferase
VTTRDGESIYVAVQNAGEWTRLCADVLLQPALLADPRFATNSLRVAHRADLDAVISGVTRALTAGELTARLDAAQIAWARMSSMREFLAHPQLGGRGRWRQIDSPAGPLRALAPPVEIDGVEPAMGAVPALGAHTDAVLEELGFSRARVAAWRSEGTI